MSTENLESTLKRQVEDKLKELSELYKAFAEYCGVKLSDAKALPYNSVVVFRIPDEILCAYDPEEFSDLEYAFKSINSAVILIPDTINSDYFLNREDAIQYMEEVISYLKEGKYDSAV